MSLIYFKLIRPNSRIVAFEPDILSYNILKKNVSFHGFSDVTLINKAVSNIDTSKQLFIHNEHSIDIPPICSLFQNSLTPDSYLVECINFGEFTSNFDFIDFLKIDIEGGESDLLESLLESASIQRINCVTLEYHKWVKQKYNLEDFIAKLEQNSFTSIICKEEKIVEDYKHTSGNVLISAHR